MDFNVPEKMRTILDMMREFVKKELIPLEAEFRTKTWEELKDKVKEKQEMVKKMELWAPNFPKEIGGMGLGLMEHALVSEVLGECSIGHVAFGCQAPDAGNIEILHKFGTSQQKERFLLPLLDGKIRSCFSMTEPGMPGSNPVMMETTAIRDGDDYVINGHKWFTSSADGADFAIVMAITNPEENKYLRTSMIIVPCDTPGFNLVRNIPVMGHAGQGRGSHAEILYQSCRVPRENLLGEEGKAFVIAQERLGPGRIHHCMRWIGICNRVFELMCQRANERMIAEDATLGSKDIVRAWIAECAAEIQCARLMVMHAGWKVDQVGAKEARNEIHLIKFKAAQVLEKVLDTAIQIHGGLGMTDDTPIASLWRHNRANRILDGADEVHKIAVAKRILKQYQNR